MGQLGVQAVVRGSGFCVWDTVERWSPGQSCLVTGGNVFWASGWGRWYWISSHPHSIPQPQDPWIAGSLCLPAVSLQYPLLRKLNIVLTLKEKHLTEFLCLLQSRHLELESDYHVYVYMYTCIYVYFRYHESYTNISNSKSPPGSPISYLWFFLT